MPAAIPAPSRRSTPPWPTGWRRAGPNAIIRIRDNRTYAEAISIEPAAGGFLGIEAADGFRPHLRLHGPLTITGNHPDASVTLGGLLVEGRVQIEGSLGRLRLLHTTLVPGVSIADPDPTCHRRPPCRWKRASPPWRRTPMASRSIPSCVSRWRSRSPARCACPITPRDCSRSIRSSTALGAAAVRGIDAADAFGPPCRLERVTVRGETRGARDRPGDRGHLRRPRRGRAGAGRLRALLLRRAAIAHAAALPLPARSGRARGDRGARRRSQGR